MERLDRTTEVGCLVLVMKRIKTASMILRVHDTMHFISRTWCER